MTLAPIIRFPVRGAARPQFRRPPARRLSGRSLGQTFDEMLGISETVGDIIRLGAHGATSYLGFYVGANARGLTSTLGYAVGVVQGLGAFMDLLDLVRLAGAPAQEAVPPPRVPAFPLPSNTPELMEA